tara:strand:- start:1560 stop:2246 length:687 start_codon:yes stop_codon:yes gene_type:complete
LLTNGQRIPVHIRSSQRAQRILLHVSVFDGNVEIVLPTGAMASEGLRFAASQTDWIAEQLSRIGSAVPFADGAVFPLLGKQVIIRRIDSFSALPRLVNGKLIVGGRQETLPGRVRRWIRYRAMDEIRPRVEEMEKKIGCRHAKISLRDTRSRWGSCSRVGNLNFSWRLVMAPEDILNYVVAHEVAHLRELNHSAPFWALVDTLCSDVGQARSWLKANGAGLHRFGRDN